MTSPEPSEAVAELARRLGVDETPSAALQQRIADAIADAEDDVVGYLGRPITPVQRTAHNVWPVPFGVFGWGLPDSSDPVTRIVSATAETFTDPVSGATMTTGTFTVVYELGLNYLTDPELRPIRRYVKASVVNNPELLQYVARTLTLRGPVKSVSVSTEGQSKNVTYAQLGYGGGGQAGSDSPGALPAKSSMDKWRLAGRRVHQAPDQYPDPRVTDSGWVRDRDGFWNTL